MGEVHTVHMLAFVHEIGNTFSKDFTWGGWGDCVQQVKDIPNSHYKNQLDKRNC